METIRFEELNIDEFVEKRIVFDTDLVDKVKKIVYDVKFRGDRAVVDYTRKFDNVLLKVEDIEVCAKEIENAKAVVSAEIYEALEFAKKNIQEFQNRFIEQNTQTNSKTNNIICPLNSVGIYVPGGRAPLVSTVLMTVLPAKIAGVEKIVVVTPPQKNGTINPYILAACDLCGVNKIYRAGGAQAIAALGFGTETIPKVDKIAGPGNIFVTLAKKELYGYVDIDMVAGPSEILVVSDDDNNPDWVAADLLSQAEHDDMASSFLICFSKEFALKVEESIEKLLEKLDTKETALKSLNKNGKIFIVKNNEQAIKIINKIAPEHLELMLCQKDIDIFLPQIRNAGAVFLGKYTPEAMGDYVAGPSHVLPTTGSARFFSPLSTKDFYKNINIISYDKENFQKDSKYASLIANLEGLSAHALSIEVRREK